MKVQSRVTLLPLVFLFPAALYANSQEYAGTGSVTQGEATTKIESLFECELGRARVAGQGEIVDIHGETWTVPADNEFLNGPYADNMYDECSGNRSNSINDVDVQSVPVVTVDESGDIITGYLFADNYFELYINGQLIAVDAVPFTPFNSSVVKFKVNRPYTIAIKLIDWEENLGVGSESGRGNSYQPGDGGLIASFSDGTVTSDQWRAQTFYIAPIYDLSCVVEKGTLRESAACDTSGRNSADDIYALHWALPNGWQTDTFDHSGWPLATTYTEQQIGVNNKNGYMNFQELFTGKGAEFIWSTNLILDNEVIVRYTVE
jgi:hypothetical protein